MTGSHGWIGYEHSVLLDPSGAVWTVGKGSGGQLGHGNAISSSALQRVTGMPPCAMVGGGEDFSVCVSRTGDVYCFGANDHGQLGLGHRNNVNTPQRVGGMPPIRSLACGRHYVMCVGRDFSVWAFGQNEEGQLGLGHFQNASTPHRVGNVKAIQVACGFDHTLILSEDGQVYGCGNASQGQLGSLRSRAHSPTPIGLPFKADSVHCGNQFSILRADDGTIWSAGHDNYGQRGLEGSGKEREFEQIPNLITTQVSCGYHHVVAIDDQSQLWGWGRSVNNELGTGSSNRASPTKIGENVKTILPGFCHTIIRTHDEKVWVCGYNRYGQLANGSDANTGWVSSATIKAEMVGEHQESQSLRLVDWQDFRKCISLGMEDFRRLSEIDLTSRQVQQMLDSSSSKVRVPAAPLSLGSWSDCSSMLSQKVNDFLISTQDRKTKHIEHRTAIEQHKQHIVRLAEQLKQEKAKLIQLKQQEQDMEEDLKSDNARLEVLHNLLARCETYATAENQYHEELQYLLSQQPLRTLDADQMELVWWRAGLSEEQGSNLNRWGITGDIAARAKTSFWEDLKLTSLESSRINFTLSMLERPAGLRALRRLDEEDCVVCNSCSSHATKNLLRERQIQLKKGSVDGWIIPYLIEANLTKKDVRCNVKDGQAVYIQTMHGIRTLQEAHQDHLSDLAKDLSY